ncbi:MAG: LytTR family transcriptional regulator DNA-binding domain-containing protein [Bacteroidota bacterium]|nr:LytTR family transcriptional regulator DNA-binding domain-containing protein [Bacteroidota bacterium]
MPELQCLLTGIDLNAFRLLIEYAAKLPWMNIIGKAMNAREARHYLQEFDIDILFCDAATVTEIEMESFLKKKAGSVLTIVVASPEELVTSSFKCDVFSFLEKPVSFEKFFNAVSYAKTYLQTVEKKGGNQSVDYVFVKSEYRFYKIKFNEIVFCESMKDYTQIHLVNKSKPIITLQNLKTFVSKLPKEDFIRVHRSFVVSLGSIDVISKNEIIIGQKFIPIGDSYRSSLFQLVHQAS